MKPTVVYYQCSLATLVSSSRYSFHPCTGLCFGLPRGTIAHRANIATMRAITLIKI